jgi:hypothetical protein
MTDHNAITPPPWRVQEWYDQAKQDPCGPINWVAVSAAQWGADQELEACCHLLTKQGFDFVEDLRAARRPKPPSLKGQALALIDACNDPDSDHLDDNALATIRRALEQLDD